MRKALKISNGLRKRVTSDPKATLFFVVLVAVVLWWLFFTNPDCAGKVTDEASAIQCLEYYEEYYDNRDSPGQ